MANGKNQPYDFSGRKEHFCDFFIVDLDNCSCIFSASVCYFGFQLV